MQSRHCEAQLEKGTEGLCNTMFSYAVNLGKAKYDPLQIRSVLTLRSTDFPKELSAQYFIE